MARSAPLVLSITGDSSGLTLAANASKQALAEMVREGGDYADLLTKHIEKMGGSAKAAVANMTSALNADVRAMMSEARNAMELGKDFKPVGGMSAASNAALAASYRQIIAAKEEDLAASRRMIVMGEMDVNLHKQLQIGLQDTIAKLNVEAEALEHNAVLLGRMEAVRGGAAAKQIESNRAVAVSQGQMRAGAQQLSYQMNDVATQVSMGTSLLTVFAQQAPQTVQAINLMTAGGNKFTAFMQSTWGAAVLGGVTILGMLIAKSDLFRDAVQEQTDKLKDNAKDSEIARQAKERFGQTEEGVREAILDQKDALDKQAESLKTEAERSLEAAKANLAHEVAIRNKTKALLEDAVAQQKIDQIRASAPGQRGELAALSLEVSTGNVSALEAKLSANEKSLAQAQANLGNAQSFADIERGVRGASPTAQIEKKYNDLIEAARKRALAEGKVGEALEKQVTALERQKKAEVDRANAAARDSKRGNADAASMADFGPVLQGNFRVTSGFGAKRSYETHPGIDYAAPVGTPVYAPQAGMVQFAAMSGKSGNLIKLDHGSGTVSNFLHLSGFAVQQGDLVDKGDLLGYTGNTGHSTGPHLDYRVKVRGKYVDPSKARFPVDETQFGQAGARAAGLQQRQAERDAAELVQGYAMQDETLLKAHTDKQVQGLRAEQGALEFKNQMLDIEGQLAPTLKDRRRIALEILDNDRKIAKLKNDEALAAHQITLAEHDAKATEIDQLFGGRRNVVAQQNAGPLDQYRKHLHDAVGDTNEALEGVKANGLQSLEDGLVGIITETESVSQAFKRMAISILADLARIAIQKAILSVIGFSTGNVPGHATGHVPGFADGIISGPGTGTSDSILAWHQGMGMIRVSNGESIITAEGTRKHRRLLKAINDNTLPSFAGGMMGDVSHIRYPAAPSPGSLGGSHGQPVFLFDMRGAITTAELMAQINGRMQQVGMAAMVGGSQLAQQELAERRLEAIPV